MRGRTAQKLVCPQCNMERDAISFWQHPDTGKRTARRYDTCLVCRASGVSVDAGSAWDWAAGLCKATSMTAAWAHRENPTIPEWKGQLDAIAIRALYRLQRGRCALTQMPLMVPPDFVRIPRHGTLAEWVQTLQPEAAGRVPVIQRVSPGADWAPGSVVLVASVIAPYVDWAGGLEGARNALGSLRTPVVPTPDAIIAARADAEEELKQEFAQERERMRHARAQATDADHDLDRLPLS